MQRIAASLTALAVVASIAGVSSAAKITCKAGATYVLPAPGGGFIVNGTIKSDNITCGPETDTIHGDGGNDHINGGGGGDTITVGNQASTAALGFNSDSTCDSKGGTITAGNGNNSLIGCKGGGGMTPPPP